MREVRTAKRQQPANPDATLTAMNRATHRLPEPVAGTASPGEARPKLWISWMTCGVDGWEHAVTDEQAVAGLQLGRGIYGAVCGRTISPQAMTGPPGRRCAHCCIFLRARYARPRTIGWWRRRVRRTGS